MKKSELKIMIKECVKEVLFEEGVLSSLIAEVAFGITKAQNSLVENKQQQSLQEQKQIQHQEEEVKRKKLLETKRKMLDAIGNEKMKNVFEGTKPLQQGSSQSPAHSPLSGRDPNDAGVDISGLFNLAGAKWNALK